MKRKVTAFLLTVVGLAILAGCDAIIEVEGQVTTPDDLPIDGATVALDELSSGIPMGSPIEATTNAAGELSLLETHSPYGTTEFQLTITAAGFNPHTETLPGSEQHRRDVMLEPSDSKSRSVD